jgi:hypothetical protein
VLWLTFAAPSGRAGEYDLGDVSLEFERDDRQRRLPLDGEFAVHAVLDRDAFDAGVNKELWAEAIIVERFNAMREEVGRAVAEGRRRDAHTAIETYRAQVAPLNERYGVQRIDGNLAETEELQVAVQQSFVGADHADKRNRFSKDTSAEGWGARNSMD